MKTMVAVHYLLETAVADVKSVAHSSLSATLEHINSVAVGHHNACLGAVSPAFAIL